MDATKLEQAKQLLLAKKEEIKKELSRFAEKNPDQQDDYRTRFPDYGDEEEQNAAEVETFANNLSLEQNLEKELQDINQALEKIKQGSYGQCAKCSQAINEERLKARPAAILCIDCQRQSE